MLPLLLSAIKQLTLRLHCSWKNASFIDCHRIHTRHSATDRVCFMFCAFIVTQNLLLAGYRTFLPCSIASHTTVQKSLTYGNNTTYCRRCRMPVDLENWCFELVGKRGRCARKFILCLRWRLWLVFFLFWVVQLNSCSPKHLLRAMRCLTKLVTSFFRQVLCAVLLQSLEPCAHQQYGSSLTQGGKSMGYKLKLTMK